MKQGEIRSPSFNVHHFLTPPFFSYIHPIYRTMYCVWNEKQPINGLCWDEVGCVREGSGTYDVVLVFPFHLGEIHAAVVGLPPLLALLVLHRRDHTSRSHPTHTAPSQGDDWRHPNVNLNFPVNFFERLSSLLCVILTITIYSDVLFLFVCLFFPFFIKVWSEYKQLNTIKSSVKTLYY